MGCGSYPPLSISEQNWKGSHLCLDCSMSQHEPKRSQSPRVDGAADTNTKWLKPGLCPLGRGRIELVELVLSAPSAVSGDSCGPKSLQQEGVGVRK